MAALEGLTGGVPEDSWAAAKGPPGARGGNMGFYDIVAASMSDAGDGARPQFGEQSWVAGVVLMVGAPGLAGFLEAWHSLAGLFGDTPAATGLESPPPVTGLSASVGVDIAKSGSKLPSVLVSWDPPVPSLVSPTPRWELAREILYRVADTDTYLVELQQHPTAFFEGNLSDLTPGATVTTTDKKIDALIVGVRDFDSVDSTWVSNIPLLSMLESEVLVAAIQQQSSTYLDLGEVATLTGGIGWDQRDFSSTGSAWGGAFLDLTRGNTYHYRLARVYRRVVGSVVLAGDKLSTITYESATKDGAASVLKSKAQLTAVLSPLASINVPSTGSAKSRGTPPDWKAAPVASLMPAALGDLLKVLTDLVKQLRSFLKNTTTSIERTARALAARVEKLELVVTRIQVLVESLRPLLSMDLGGHALWYFGKGGNSFFLELLGTALRMGNVEEREAAAEAAASYQEKTNLDALADAKSTLDSSWAQSGELVPNYKDSDYAAGVVIMLGDESAQALKNAMVLLEMLFGAPDDSQSPEAKAEEKLGSTASALSAGASALGPEAVSNQKEAFSRSLEGVDPEDSDDNRCPTEGDDNR
jgi:hypothetical protein